MASLNIHVRLIAERSKENLNLNISLDNDSIWTEVFLINIVLAVYVFSWCSK